MTTIEAKLRAEKAKLLAECYKMLSSPAYYQSEYDKKIKRIDNINKKLTPISCED